jgi:hypothetical protein
MESLTGSSVVEELWDVESTIHFTDTDNLRHAIHAFFKDSDSLYDHTILITGFSAESLVNKDDDNEEVPLIPRHSKVLYLKDLSLLIITMASSPHNTASRQFLRLLDRKLIAMNCDNELIATGGTLREMENVKKSPDESFHPIGTRNVTFALETSVSESKRALGTDAKIWLSHPESHVTQVMTIKISRTKPEVIFSLWAKTTEQMETRAIHPEKAIKNQEVFVVLEEDHSKADGSLSISFEKLFDRKPRPGTAEGDIVLSPRDLGAVAWDIWFEMRFVNRK